MLRKFILVLAGIFMIGVVCLVGLFTYRYLIYFPQAIELPSENELAVDFVIERGESVRSVSARLEDIGIVADDWLLTTFLSKKGWDTKVEAGHFNFSGGEKIPEVAEVLLRGEVKQISITIFEGWNSAEMDAKLVELDLIKPGEFRDFVRDPSTDLAKEWKVDSLEGFIFPATYRIDPTNFSVENLVKRMLEAMQRTLDELSFDATSSPKSLQEVLTMASIVELEERSETNRPKVADILWRRLESGMGLYADATLFYALGHKENLNFDDLKIDSPYNTRLNRGLPPTPISSPSKSAINAALHPELNEFWYYLHDSDGAIHFARTLTEHNENKARFIQ